MNSPRMKRFGQFLLVIFALACVLMTAAFAFAILRRGQHFGTNGFHKEKRTFRLRSSAKASRCTFSISQMIQAKMFALQNMTLLLKTKSK